MVLQCASSRLLLVLVGCATWTAISGQSRQLEVHPQFQFVNEDWTVGRALPDLSICASNYQGDKTLELKITAGDTFNHFKPRSLNGTCWTLILQKPLDADLENADGTRGQFFSLTFRCSDCGSQKEGNLDIQVVDINDNPPEFVNTDSAVSVSENAATNQVIFSVTTFDPDTGVGGIDSFRLVNDFDGTFQVRNGSCSDSKCKADVYLMKPIQYENRNVYPLEIIAFDGAGRIQTVNTVKFKVVINVVDMQNNPPKFVTDNRIRYVPENTSVGGRVFQVEAVDGDSGVSTPNQISYRLLLGAPFFRIEETTGWVIVAQKLDREAIPILKNNGAITLSVQAEEETNEDPRPRSAVNFTVLISDVNDEVPRCNQSSYSAQLPENSQTLIPITLTDAAHLYVFDNDQGSNGEFSVSLEGPGATWFDVNPKVVFQEANLLIRVRNSTHLDFESIKSVDIRVVLSPRKESGQPDGGCDVKIELLDTNDNPPTFNQSEFSGAILENQKSGTFVAKITVFDVDTQSFLPILLSLSGTGAERFSIDSQGNIRTVAVLNREEASEYQLTVVAADDSGRGNRATAALLITVLDTNDEVPVFEKQFYTAFLFENSQTFTQIPDGRLFVKATDSDVQYTNSSKISYFLDPPSLNFTINRTSGEIIPVSPGVDRDEMTTDYFNLTVLGRDNGVPQLTGTAKVVIYVNDSNDNAPIFQYSSYNASLYENARAGTFVILVSAVDKDRSEYNSRLAYRITNVQDKFIIDSTTGSITVANGASLDRERTGKGQYDLEVEAFDQGFPQQSGTTKVGVIIRDINNKPPRFPEKLQEVAVYEHAPLYTALINLTAHDPDETAKLRYKIAGYSNPLTKDGKPVIMQKYNYSKLFNVRPETGEVYTKNVLDREQLQHLTIIVNATDENAEINAPQTAQTFLDVTILDINDNPPKFKMPTYRKTVRENSEIGSVILSVTAVDPDSNSTVLYSLSGEADSLVKINERTGEITVDGPINFEERQWINFTAIAKDTGVPAQVSQAPISLQVMDQNDNSPLFHPASTYKVSIPEDSEVGSFLISVNATDLDSGSYGRVTYFLLAELGSGSARPRFVINETTGEIRVNGVLERETKDSFALTVQAVDDYTGHVNPDSHEATAVVDVKILDVNDNAPVFSANTPRLLTLTESNSGGLQVATFVAQDADDEDTGNGRVRYFIRGGNATLAPGIPGAPRIQMFDLEPQSGLLTLATDLTGLSGVYVIGIEARDLGEPGPLSSNISVTIQVQDYNDNKPHIYQPQQKAVYSVPENNFTDFYVVVEVRARDKDEGDNADLRYKIRQTTVNDDWKYFSVDPISGDVYMKRELDFEKQPRYALTVQACDSGKTPLCDEVEFFVAVKDQNDNCPYFERTLNFTEELNIMENKPVQSSLGQIKAATDRDTASENVAICYKIVERYPPRAPFRMSGPSSNEIITTETLDREKLDTYRLVVQARDCMETGFCAQQSQKKYSKYISSDKSLLLVGVRVVDANDNPPHFVQTLFRGGIQYDTKIGSRVTRVRAVDADIVDSGRLRYYLLGPIIPRLSEGRVDTERPPFNLNDTTGDLTTNIELQPSWKGIFEFTVLVNDTAGQRDTTRVVINLLSFDQQVELVFESPANQIWDNSPEIIKLLSEVTESNATIDDVQPYEKIPGVKSLESQSKVLVHFINGQSIIPVEEALQSLDIPKTANQRTAKQKLISVHRLKYAGQNVEPVGSPDYTLYFALAGVIGGLLLILLVLVAIWCHQNRNYKRKLKAATTLAFGSTDIAVPSYDVPGTNLHSNSNPVWSPNYTGMENYGVDYDRVSQGSHNSLDENDVDDKGSFDTASTDADRTLPSRHTHNGNGFLSPTHALHLKNNNDHNQNSSFSVRSSNNLSQNDSRTVSQQSRTSSSGLPQKNGDPVGSLAGSDGLYGTSRGTSPPPNYPQPIMASLASTEL